MLKKIFWMNAGTNNKKLIISYWCLFVLYMTRSYIICPNSLHIYERSIRAKCGRCFLKEKRERQNLFSVINKIETNTITARAQVWYKLWILWCVRVISDQKFVKNKDHRAESGWWTRMKNLNMWMKVHYLCSSISTGCYFLNDGLILRYLKSNRNE